MERNGPAVVSAAVAPLRRLVSAPDRKRPPMRSRFLRYTAPVGLLALIGIGLAVGDVLLFERDLGQVPAALLAAGSVLPVAVVFRRPLLAWRIAYPMLFLGVWRAGGADWPWNPAQVLGTLLVLGVVAVTEESGVTAWATGLVLVPVFLFAAPSVAWGAAMVLVAVALLGDVLSRRRLSRRQLAEQAEVTDLERARRAVLEERTRIAREMHDVVAHHMSMIAVQAETAPFRVGGLPAGARDEFTAIAASARAALGDMRRLLGVLRADGSGAQLAPQPGLADLPALVATAERAGVPVTARLPAATGVSPAVGLAAYRIVQEALANAVRHAPGGAVRIDGRVLGDRLKLTVDNDRTRPGGADGAGHGLAGMRERAALLGGTLDAAPDGPDHYRVTAVLPLTTTDREQE